MTSHPLVQVFEAMMEKQQIPDERFLMTKKKEKKWSKQRSKYRNSIAVNNPKVVYNKWKKIQNNVYVFYSYCR
jgi:hypothetical protein